MAMMAPADLKKHVDFEKLKHANGLLLKWGQRFGIPKPKFVRWAMLLHKNYEEHKNQLPQNLRSTFSKDFKVMFYACEVESILIEQYQNMIYKIIQKTKIPDDLHEDYFCEGMNIIRYAVWSFRKVKSECSFTTFCYNSLAMRVQGEYWKRYKTKMRRHKKVQVYLESDKHTEINLDDFIGTNHVVELAEEQEAGILQKMIEKAGLTEAEILMLKSYMARGEKTENKRRKKWYEEYEKKYLHTFKTKRCTRQGIQQKMKRLQKKLWVHFHDVLNLPVPPMDFAISRSPI